MEGRTGKIRKYDLAKRSVLVEGRMIQSEPYRLLSAKAAWVLLRFYHKRTWSYEGKRRRKRIFENNGLVFTYAEAEYFGISKSQFHTIIKKLVEFGFLDVEHQGGCYGRDYSRYRISERWRLYGTSMFQKVTKQRVLQAGLDVQSRKAKLEKGTENRNK